MNRRGFLQLLGAGLPATVVAEKLGLIERVRSYFFAPNAGWYPQGLYPQGLSEQVIALQLEAITPYISNLIESDHRLFHYFGASKAALRVKYEYPKVEFEKALLIG